MSPSSLLQGSKTGKPLTELQEKFIRVGFEGFNDQEIIELVLSLVSPQQQCQQRAKELIDHFKTLRNFLIASPEELKRAGITPSCMFGIKLLHDLPIKVLEEKIMEQPAYLFSQEFFDYLSYSMRDFKKEVFKVIYLNNRNQIINAEDLFEGTLESIPIRPREIVESAIKYSATRLIFAHNHPAGDPTPSRSDKQLTRDLVFMGMILQIKVLDHIVIGKNTYFSFADEGLIEKYEDNFLNLKIRSMFEGEEGHHGDLYKFPALHPNRKQAPASVSLILPLKFPAEEEASSSPPPH